MFRLDADKKVHFCDGVTRRDFLHAGALGFLGLSMPQILRLQAMADLHDLALIRDSLKTEVIS